VLSAFHFTKRLAIALKPSSTTAGEPSGAKNFAPIEMAAAAKRWPERSNAMP
jgi:hypothetical protein